MSATLWETNDRQTEGERREDEEEGRDREREKEKEHSIPLCLLCVQWYSSEWNAKPEMAFSLDQ